MIELLLGGWDNIRSTYTQEQIIVPMHLRQVKDIGDFKKEYSLPGQFKTKIELITTKEWLIFQIQAMSQNEYDSEQALQLQQFFHEKGKQDYFQVMRKNNDLKHYEMIMLQRTKARVPLHIRRNWMTYIAELKEEKNIDYNLDQYYKTIRPAIEFTKNVETHINTILEAHKHIGIETEKANTVVLYTPSSIKEIPDICLYLQSQEVRGIQFIDQV